jgi:2-haloalkanoic acid dehalogenase type II
MPADPPFDPPFAGVKACVFDAYGTLFDVHSAVARYEGQLGGNGAELSALWRQKQLEYTWLRSLMGRHADFRQITSDALDYAFARYGFDDKSLAEELLLAYDRLDAYEDAAACLQALAAKGLTRAILSNGTPQMLESALLTPGSTTWSAGALPLNRARLPSCPPMPGTQPVRPPSVIRSPGSTGDANQSKSYRAAPWRESPR